MSKKHLAEDLFAFIEEKDSARPGRERIIALREATEKAELRTPPDDTWLRILEQKNAVASATQKPGFFHMLFSDMRVAAFALALVGILVGAFFLLNTATAPKTIQLVELAALQTQKPGDTVIARGMRIKALGESQLNHVPGATEKIYLRSGSFEIALQHDQLEKPTRFIYPGGSLEPLGTAFTVEITAAGTRVNLREGKIRVVSFEAQSNRWNASEVTAPYTGNFGPTAVENVPDAPLLVEPPKVAPKAVLRSRFSSYVGKQVTVELSNGDRMTGRLVAAAGSQLRLITGSGELKIPESQIKSINKN